MKAVLFAIALVPMCASAITEAQKMFLDGRRIAIARKVEDGKVITTWARNGKVESVVTNVLKVVAGVKVNNPLEDRISLLTSKLTVAQAGLDEKKRELAVAVRRNDAIVEKLNALKAEYEDKKNKAVLSTMKSVYQLFIDVIDDLLGVE